MAENNANDFIGALAADFFAVDTQFTLVSEAGTGLNPVPAAPFRVRIGNELILVSTRVGTLCSNLTRGAESTTIASHNAGTPVRQVVTVLGLADAVATVIPINLATQVTGDLPFAHIVQIAAARLLGSIAGGDIAALTGTQATTLLDAFTSVLKGLAPASGGGTSNFLRADGTWAAPSGTAGITSLTTDVVAAGPGAAVATIQPDAVTNSKLANMAAATVKGTIAGGDPADLTQAQLTTLVNAFTSLLSGAVPASGGGTTNFLRADGTFAVPPGTGGGQRYAIRFVLDGGGSDIPTGVQDAVADVVVAGTIVAWRLYSVGGAASIEINVQKSDVAGYDTFASITAGNNPALTSDKVQEDTDLADWSDVAVATDDIFRVSVVSNTGTVYAVLTLVVQP